MPHFGTSFLGLSSQGFPMSRGPTGACFNDGKQHTRWRRTHQSGGDPIGLPDVIEACFDIDAGGVESGLEAHRRSMITVDSEAVSGYPGNFP